MTILRNLILLAGIFSLAGCKTKGPDFIPPAPPAASAGYGKAGASAAMGEGPGITWWTGFGSAELDKLVTQALKQNHSLAASKATLARARDRILATGARANPQADARAEAQYQKFNLSSFGLDGAFGGAPISNPDFDLYTVGGGVSYDLDLFGRNKRALEGAIADAQAVQRQTEAAHLIVAGRVVSQVLTIAALNDRIAAQRALIGEDERNVTLTQKRQRGGEGTMVEVLSAQSQLAGDRVPLPGIEQQLAEARSMLAILTGVSPAELAPTAFSLDQFALPGTVPVAIPSKLVHKRPDILAAEARLHSSVAAIGVAEASFYPNVTIGAQLTQTAGRPDQLFSGRANGFNFFSTLTAPLLDGGRRKAELAGAQDQAKADAETYQQVVLEAFGQVADLLNALDTDGRTLAAQRAATDVAAKSLHLSRRSFEVGNSGILQVLDAARAHQRAKLALLDARARQYLNIARLQVATAGGWIEGRADQVPQ